MNFQYYDLLQDKSKKRVLFLLEHINPKLTSKELEVLMSNLINKSSKVQKSLKSKVDEKFVSFSKTDEKFADLTKLKPDQLEVLYKIFISREDTSRLALKWRFYQYYKYIQSLKIKSVEINPTTEENQPIDLLFETEENQVIIVLCFDVLDLKKYNASLPKIEEYANKRKVPNQIIFATNKSYRNIPIDIPLKINDVEIEPELKVEWMDENQPFNGEDLIIVNNNEVKVAGFNYSGIDDLLEFVYKTSSKGQVSIYKQTDFFSEVIDEIEPNLDMIWKGIMIKK